MIGSIVFLAFCEEIPSLNHLQCAYVMSYFQAI